LDILFLHPNFPGQFRHLATALARDPGCRVWGLGDADWTAKIPPVAGVHHLSYPTLEPPRADNPIHPWVRPFEQAVRRGEAVIKALEAHREQGLEPDVIVAHPGWGDAFFVRDLFPGVRVVGLFEYFYRARGADVGFDPEFPSRLSDVFRLHALNATQLLALESCDSGICPTHWQKSRFPSAYADKLQVQHEGIDTVRVRPDPNASLTLNNGLTLKAGDEVLTYVSRSLEPYRGFHVFMRALPTILRQRPDCQVLIVGRDGAGYGPAPRDGGTWKARCLAEIGHALDLDRVHFLGPVAYENYLKVLQVSRVHTYLTYPFVLSWSMMEAMAAGCVLVASDTAPVREMVRDGWNGRLVPFKDHIKLAAAVTDALRHPENHASLGTHARKSMVAQFDFETVALPAYRQCLQLD